MVINKNSWHYKVFAWTYRYAPPAQTNLCHYMRRLIIAAPLAVLVMICMIPILIIGRVITAIVLLPLGYRPDGFFPTDNVRFISVRQLGLFGEWMKARKEKMCPLIEFEE